MRLKALLGSVAAFGIILGMNVCANAATYAVENVTKEGDGNKVTFNLTVTPDAGESTTGITLNGFALTVGYDEGSVVALNETGVDITGDDMFASASGITQDGVFVADKIDSDDDGVNDKLAIGWAAADAKTIKEKATLATFSFTLNDESKSMVLPVKLIEVARDANTLENVSEINVLDGKVTVGKLGDVNNDGVVDANDSTLVIQHVVQLKKLSDEDLVNADVNDDGVVDANDSTLIIQRVVQLISKFPAE